MSKKHYIAIANVIRANPSAFTPDSIRLLSDFFKSENAAFKPDRWIAYIKGECGPNGGSVKK